MIRAAEITFPVGSYQVDWGGNHGQGKRSGGAVLGAMADPPRGVKTYQDFAAHIEPESQAEARSLFRDNDAGRELYLKARSIGLSHEVAVYAGLSSEYDAEGLEVVMSEKGITIPGRFCNE